MATKLRNLATSAITKTILWILLISFSFLTFKGFVTIYRTAVQNNLPVASLDEMEYTDSYDFMLSKRDIVSALYWKYDISKLYNVENLPAFYYRAEYADGSVTTNASGKDAEFFKSHRVYGIYKTLPNGEWQEISVSNEDRTSPSAIAYDNIQFFPSDTHSFSRSYTLGEEQAENAFALPLPEDIPEALAWQLSHGNTYSTYSYTNDFGITYNYPSSHVPTVRSESNAFAELSEEQLDAERQRLEAEYQQWLRDNPIPSATVYYAFDDTSIATYESFWYQCRSYYIAQFGSIIVLVLGAFAAAIWLLAACGRRPADTELHLLPTERLWSEVTLGAGFFAFFGLGSLFFIGMENMVHNKLYNDINMVNLYCLGLTALAVVVVLISMSLIRLMKAKRLIRNSLTFKVCHWFWIHVKRTIDALRSCFDERSMKGYPLTKALQRRQIVYFAALGGLLLLMLFFILMDGGYAAFFLTLFLIAILAGISYWHVKGNIMTYSEINKGFNESFDEQMKSERTKTALVTNVSHDLKTPLTSIITYVDLLSKEELPDSARDYVTVLAQKSERLKSIVADLFDLSKSASGNIPLDMEVLDLKRLIEQTVADMRDNIDASELILKVKLPEEEVNIYSDGKKLYRVFQNIIDNALKYSMSGTRVFITLETESGMAVATVKNTAAYEMDFTADDVLQRFSRGDKSRTSEGSGLGLSIAESFTRACGGDFKVDLDGDLFKVTIAFAVK